MGIAKQVDDGKPEWPIRMDKILDAMVHPELVPRGSAVYSPFNQVRSDSLVFSPSTFQQSERLQ